MVNFRRVVTVLAVLALFTGMAFAQSELCNAQGTVSTPLRAEGYTEMSGDIIITCTSGQALAIGAPIPLINITVFYNTTVTSRLLSTTANNAGQVPSEALLLIDEPNTGLMADVTAQTKTFGTTLGLIPCTTPTTGGCPQFVGAPVGGFATAVTTAGGTNYAPNVYQGLTAGNSVTFYGVPALPPSTVGSRVYRITNVRVDATKLGGAAAGTTPIQAFITAPSFPISNSQPIVGYPQPGLLASVKGAKGFNQCVSATNTSTTTALTFTELFGTSFKTRVTAQTTAAGAGQNGNVTFAPAALNQSTPGQHNDSESGFVYNGFPGATAGLADYGTRLKATFNNVPAGVRIFVNSANTTTPALPGGSGGNFGIGDNPGSYAAIVSGDGSSSDGSGITPAAYPLGTETSEVSIVSGTGTAVWEVLNTNPNATETISFGVFISYTAATATNSPLPGTATVTLTYAPTSTSGVASNSLPIPRFGAGNTPFTGTVFTINVCRTILLYPYITNQAGFDTGLTVANTSQDPFTTGSNATGAQKGTCTFTFYGGTTAAPTTPPAPYPGPNDPPVLVSAGTVWANTLGTIAPTFQGYMFAVCNFQFAHGFAFISDVGARNLAMGYLALVIPDPGALTGIRTAAPFGTGTASGEQDAH